MKRNIRLAQNRDRRTGAQRAAVVDGRLLNSSVPGRVLLIAYHFPPDASSTGRLRTLGFMDHLPAFGWQPAVLTAHERAYERVDEDGIADIPASLPVCRAFALDTRRHLGWRGKYLALLATPDRWISWWPDAVRVGLRMIRTQRIDAIWSTFPIMTSHLVGLSLSRLTGLPWVADFRDPVVSNGDGPGQRICRGLERRVVLRAARTTLTTPGACRLYARRFRDVVDGSRFSVIPNGYEESKFRGLVRPERVAGAPCTLVHGGLLYRDGRDPGAFFQALAELKACAVIGDDNLHVVLRASGNEQAHGAELERLGLTDMVELAAPVSYREALQEQAAADGLLLFQGERFNAQIPAKVYDYLRIGAPIIALADSAGDTVRLLRDMAGIECVAMDDVQAIAGVLQAFVARWRNGTLPSPDAGAARCHSRRAAARRLARVLDEVVKDHVR